MIGEVTRAINTIARKVEEQTATTAGGMSRITLELGKVVEQFKN